MIENYTDDYKMKKIEVLNHTIVSYLDILSIFFIFF